MSSEKNSKKNGIEKLRILLDKKSLKKLDPEDEKYLIALKKRLDTPSSSKIVIKKIVETPQTDESYLKPKVIIHTRKQEIKPISKIIVEEKPKQQETEPIFKEVTEAKKTDDDLIEIKKVEVKQPEFLEVKPKTAKKEENITTIKETKNEEGSESLEHEINNEEIEELTEWEPVIDKKEQVVEKESSEPKEEIFTEIEDKQIEIENLCPKCGNKTKKDSNFCQSCGFKLNQDFEEKKQNPTTEESVPCFIPVEKPDEDIDWKQEEAQHSLIESETKEIISVEPTNEEEVLDFKDSKIEKIVETDLEKEKKKEAFKEIENIDEKTAIILYDNGYTTIDSLKNTTIQDLKKIKGIKKKKAKKIISEIEEKILESTDPKPITVDETAEGELTQEQIKDEKIIFEEEKDDDYKVEFHSKKAKWTPIEEDQDFKEEKTNEPTEEKTLDEEPIEENKENEKIEIFAEIENIDKETAIILYNHGFTSIELLKNTTIQDLKKIKGIKKKKAKDIIFEIESRFKEAEPDKPITEEYDAEYFEEEFDEDLKKVDEQIKKFEDPEIQEDKEDTEFFEDEIEDVPEIQPDEKDESVFREIESIDNKISALLIKNGIDTIEKLNGTPIKELIKIKGIRKKTAKQIKKEVEMNIKINRSEDEKSYDNIKENPYIKNEDDQIEEEWESIDNKKTSKKQRTIYGFMYNEYTLYEKEIITKSGSKRMVRFFSKGEPEDAKPIDIPEGYEVDENKSGVPYLRKIKD